MWIGRGLLLGAALVVCEACDPTIHLGTDFIGDASAALLVDARQVEGSSSNETDSPAPLDAVIDAGVVDGMGAVDGRATIVWSAGFETGTISEWESDGLGGTYTSMNTAIVVTNERAHSGSYAAKLTINPMGGNIEDRYLFRGGAGAPPALEEAYYGAWFFIPQPYIENFYWNLFHFLQSPAADRQGTNPVWDLNLRSNLAGDLVPYVYDFLSRRQRDEPTPTPVPIAQWFHLEVFVRFASDTTGRVAVWHDGHQVFDIPNVVTASTPWILWAIGSASTDIMPAPADLFIDDVTLSTTRVGP